MSDSDTRVLERAAAQGDTAAAEALIVERIRAGGRDPRHDPHDKDVVQERERPARYRGARVVVTTWPRLLKLGHSLPARAIAEGGAERWLGTSLVTYESPNYRLMRRPRRAEPGRIVVEVQVDLALDGWALYDVDASSAAWRSEPSGAVETVEWQGWNVSRGYAMARNRRGEGTISAVHAWRDWCRGGRVVRMGPPPA